MKFIFCYIDKYDWITLFFSFLLFVFVSYIFGDVVNFFVPYKMNIYLKFNCFNEREETKNNENNPKLCLKSKEMSQVKYGIFSKIQRFSFFYCLSSQKVESDTNSRLRIFQLLYPSHISKRIKQNNVSQNIPCRLN